MDDRVAHGTDNGFGTWTCTAAAERLCEEHAGTTRDVHGGPRPHIQSHTPLIGGASGLAATADTQENVRDTDSLERTEISLNISNLINQSSTKLKGLPFHFHH